jgi:hypothetical protein
VAVRVKTSQETLAAKKLVPRYATKKIVFGIRVIGKPVGAEDPVFTSVGALLYGTKPKNGQFLNGKRVCE